MARRKHNEEEMLGLSNRIFQYSTDFHEAFPNLSGGKIDYSQTGPRGTLGYPSRAHDEYLHTSYLELEFPIIKCEQVPVCRRGGFELYQTISKMIRADKSEEQFELRCAGFTGRLRPNTAEQCRNTLRCRITLEYKSEAEKQQAT